VLMFIVQLDQIITLLKEIIQAKKGKEVQP
jgi:hypothetical protein